MLRIIFILTSIHLFTSTVAQTYDTRPMKGGNGTLLQTEAWVDAAEYSVITFEFQPRTVVTVFLDPNQKELARHEMNGAAIKFFGYSSNEREFIIYFTGQVDGKNSNKLYFLCFFKSGNRPPIFTEWFDFPDARESSFTYSLNDKLCLANVDKKANTLTLTEFSTINIKTQKTFRLSETTTDLIRDQSFAINYDAPVKKTLDMRNFYLTDAFQKDYTSKAIIGSDSIQFVILRDGRIISRDVKKLYLIVLNRATEKVSEKEYDFEFGSEVNYDIVNNKMFVVTTSPTSLAEDFVDLEVLDYKTMTSLKKYHFSGTDSISIKQGPFLNLETGEEYDKTKDGSKTKRIIREMNTRSLITATLDNNGNYRLRLGSIVETQPSVPVYTGSGMHNTPAAYAPFAFPACLDKDFNPCVNVDSDPYFDALSHFWNLPVKKNTSDRNPTKFYYAYAASRIITYFYNAKSKQYSVAHVLKK